jgi:predicted Zn finger-like uncharacterized protein
MKIVCDNCATKYSIADEKVRGKVFKIRCKKCSHIIVVRGGEGAAATQDAAGADAGFPGEEPAPVSARGGAAPLGTGEAVWHLVVDREQIGPLTREEVHVKFRGGEVDLETYAWREGFADWLRLGSIEDFRDLAGDAPAAPAQGEGATRRTDTADLFATAASAPDDAPSTGGDLFGGHNSSSAPTGEAQMPANEIFNQQGGGLFGAQAAAVAAPAPAAAPAPRPQRNSSPAFGGNGGGAAMAASAESEAPAASGSQKMTGQRNENSVLFSLNNLQALASGGGGGGGGSSKAASAPAEARPGFANSQTEGSGLIDIRAMAASTLSPAGGNTSSKGGSSEEPAFASAPMFSPMAAPILMPAPASGPPKWIWALLGVGVLAVLGIVVVGVLLLTRKPEPQAVATVTPAVAAPGPAAAPPAAAGNPAAVPPAAAPVAVAAAKPDEPKAPADDKHHVVKEHKNAKEPKGHEPTAAAPVVAAAPAPAAPAPKKGGGKKDELDDLLNNASPDKPAPKHSAPREEAASDSNLPDQLDKGAIVGGMSKIKAKVADCYVQFKVPGLANVSVTIGHNGRISSASVSGSFSGTPTGSCVEKAVKQASFGQFKGSPQTINYPFMLR